jgi:protein-tyrosine phosphatase
LLLEFPYISWPLGLQDLIRGLRMRGFRTVLAHPERNGDVQADPERLAQFVDAGALVQLTAASVDGRLGRGALRCSKRLIELELAHLIASDAHRSRSTTRNVALAGAVDQVGAELGRWLTVDVPRALIDGADVPARPLPRRRRGSRFGLRRA